MKRKSEVDSKAGTAQKENSTMVLKSLISKSASMLLIAMAGYGMMSFTQDDTSVNSIDTNVSAKKEKSIESAKFLAADENCCAAIITKPGDEIKKTSTISMPGAKAILNADRENAVKFITEVKNRSLYSMDIADAKEKADREMSFNFQVSGMFPSVEVAHMADLQMINHFTDEIVLKSTVFAGKYVNDADAEMSANFITENLALQLVKPSEKLIVQADAEISNAFEKVNFPSISLPSQHTAVVADMEMIQHYETEIKVTRTVATK